MSDISETLSNLLSESRRFFPPVELAINANVKIESYQEASEDRLAFWAKQASDCSGTSRGRRYLTGQTRPSPDGSWMAG